MKRITALACSALVVCAAFSLQAEEKKAELKCPVSGAAAKMDHAVEHNGGKVYFCCDKCPEAFKADTAKFATKANAQLVASGQAKQVKCPLSGGKLNPEAKVTVASTEVQFCCNNCKGKVAAAKGDEQLNLVFSDAAFKKGFEVKK
jgi:hypothetical protein